MKTRTFVVITPEICEIPGCKHLGSNNSASEYNRWTCFYGGGVYHFRESEGTRINLLGGHVLRCPRVSKAKRHLALKRPIPDDAACLIYDWQDDYRRLPEGDHQRFVRLPFAVVSWLRGLREKFIPKRTHTADLTQPWLDRRASSAAKE